MVVMPEHMFQGIAEENEILHEALREIASGRIFNAQRFARQELERADSLLRASRPVPDAPSSGDAEGVRP
jgi:flagellar biosynthesis regulator FlbT